MSLSRKLMLSTLLVLALVSLGGVAVLWLSLQELAQIKSLYALAAKSENTLPPLGELTRNHWMIPAMAMASGVAVFLFMVWNSWVAIVGVAMPLGRFSALLERFAQGDMEGELRDTHRKDEVGVIARAIEDLRTERLSAEREATVKLEDLQRKESRRIAMEEAVRGFAEGIDRVVNGLASAAMQLNGSANIMEHAAQQAQHLAGDLADEAQQVDGGMQTVARAEQDLGSTITDIRSKVQRSSDIASRAVLEAQQGTLHIQGLVEEVRRIHAVVTLITEIASQTNLLALNATIEAARAGDAGKGFAVVAGEVKTLAEQTAKATDEIILRIQAMEEATTRSAVSMDGFAGTVGNIRAIAAEITGSVDRQGGATQAIASSVHEAAKITRSLSGNVVEVMRAASETGQAAGGVLQCAGEVGQQAAILRQQVDIFLAQVAGDA